MKILLDGELHDISEFIGCNYLFPQSIEFNYDYPEEDDDSFQLTENYLSIMVTVSTIVGFIGGFIAAYLYL